MWRESSSGRVGTMIPLAFRMLLLAEFIGNAHLDRVVPVRASRDWAAIQFIGVWQEYPRRGTRECKIVFDSHLGVLP